MPRVPKSPDSPAPKKRVSKPKAEAETTTKVAKKAKTAQPKSGLELVPALPIEERIRLRAYELYLQRGGQGGSPEQDWFRAAAELSQESVA